MTVVVLVVFENWGGDPVESPDLLPLKHLVGCLEFRNLGYCYMCGTFVPVMIR